MAIQKDIKKARAAAQAEREYRPKYWADYQAWVHSGEYDEGHAPSQRNGPTWLDFCIAHDKNEKLRKATDAACSLVGEEFCDLMDEVREERREHNIYRLRCADEESAAAGRRARAQPKNNT